MAEEGQRETQPSKNEKEERWQARLAKMSPERRAAAEARREENTKKHAQKEARRAERAKRRDQNKARRAAGKAAAASPKKGLPALLKRVKGGTSRAGQARTAHLGKELRRVKTDLKDVRKLVQKLESQAGRQESAHASKFNQADSQKGKRRGSPKDRLLVGLDNISLSPITQDLSDKVDRTIDRVDQMYSGNDSHYFGCGASALNVILGAYALTSIQKPLSRILDFGAGSGRVMRWLRAAFPAAEIYGCDAWTESFEFLTEKFGAKMWESGIDIPALTAPTSFDLIWVGSVATHLPEASTEALLDKLISWTSPGGLVVMSMHGRWAVAMLHDGFPYIHDEAKPEIMRGWEEEGYGYADYEEGLGYYKGYGISMTKLSWTTKLIERRPNIRLVALSEKVWDNHHDVLVVQRLS